MTVIRRSNLFNKLFIILLLIFSIFIFTSCDLVEKAPLEYPDNDQIIGDDDLGNEDEQEDQITIDYLDIYSINDLHGAIEEDEYGRGLARMGNFLIEKKTTNPDNTVILVAGDMFQGTAISNLTYGGVVVEALNYIGIDAFTIGNHEFDWGVQRIIDLIDEKSSQVKVNFPLLGANIYKISTNQRAEWVNDYVIIERGGLKIGIIGVIGDYQINSITAPYVEGYKFLNPVPIIKSLAFELRANKNVDVVIVLAHDGDTTNTPSDSFNRKLSYLEGMYSVDAVINAHTHYYYDRTIPRQNRVELPVVQAGSSGSHIGYIRLNLDKKTKKITTVSVDTIQVGYSLSENNPTILEIIEKHRQEVKKKLDIDEALATAGTYISKDTFANWAVNVMKKYSKADFAVVNSGAFREGFPIRQNEIIDVQRVYQFMPFDNVVLTCKLTGRQLRSLARNSGFVFSSNFDVNDLEDYKEYTIATVDYLFYKTYYEFLNGREITNLHEYFRDYLILELKTYKQQNKLFFAR